MAITPTSASDEPRPAPPAAAQAPGERSTRAMRRLPFLLPDFTRTLWVSDQARAVWADRLRAITRAWFDIEWRAVAAGVRRCAITVVSPDQLVSTASTWLDHGLVSLPFEIQGAGESYASTPVAIEAGKPFVFRAVVGRAEDVRAFRAAWQASDNVAIGALLGYPACCTEFFRRTWVEDQLVDTTWAMARGSHDPRDPHDHRDPHDSHDSHDARLINVTGPPEANILWRWMGVRAVPHLPCRFDCADTVEFGRQLMQVGRDAGFREEMAWLDEILRWPAEWSALHGIAEVRTPILKVSTRTDATPVSYTVRRDGDRYPIEGAKGLNFPYRTPPQPLLTTTLAFRRGLAHELTTATPEPEWLASDNGFASVTAMRAAHAPIVALARAGLRRAGGTVLDLGCGNGALLAAIADTARGVTPFGLDYDAARIDHARLQLPVFAGNFQVGDLFDEAAPPWAGERRYDVALLMPGRFLEGIDPGRADRLRDRLRTRCARVLVYAYGDWLTRHGSLRGLTEAAGFRLREDADAGPSVSAGWAD